MNPNVHLFRLRPLHGSLHRSPGVTRHIRARVSLRVFITIRTSSGVQVSSSCTGFQASVKNRKLNPTNSAFIRSHSHAGPETGSDPGLRLSAKKSPPLRLNSRLSHLRPTRPNSETCRPGLASNKHVSYTRQSKATV